MIAISHSAELKRIKPTQAAAGVRERLPITGRQPERSHRVQQQLDMHAASGRPHQGIAKGVARIARGENVHLQPNGTRGRVDGLQHEREGVRT